MLTTKIEKTADGSPTLFVPALDEHYHSTNGALTESMHVFIKNGLQQINKNEISVLEVGFGTGLNALLTYLETASKNTIVHYTAVELYPLHEEIFAQLDYPEQLGTDRQFFTAIHRCNWDEELQITPAFILQKRNADFTKINFDRKFDLIYFDAFAPNKQPEMWTPEIFNHLYRQTNDNGVLTTYCAKGVVRRMLQAAGYGTERLPGPPGKREMLRARKLRQRPNQ